MEASHISWYLNWPWSTILAVIALILSQIPPIRILIKKAKIDLDLYSNISLTHKVGNPNLLLHLIINNIGGRKIRIKNIKATLEKNGDELIILSAQNYYQNQNDRDTVLFTKFSLKPEEEWARSTNFLNFFDHTEKREYSQYEKAMKEDLRAKQAAEINKEEHKELIELDQEVVTPMHEFFNKKFIWYAGEYTLTVNISTDRKKADITKKYRFTIFDSDEEQLKSIIEQYKFGGGIWWIPLNVQTSVILELKEI